MLLIDGSALSRALIAEGLVPEECGDIEISMPVDGAVVLKYVVFVRNVDMLKLSRAFKRVAKDNAQEADTDKSMRER